MEPLQPESEDIEEEVVHMEAAEGGVQPGPSDQAQAGGSKELKLLLEGLEMYFVFSKFVKTEMKYDGRYSRQVHTGKAKCTTCGKEYSFTTQSRAHLKCHYDKMHKAQVPPLVAAIEGQNKRGRSRSGYLDSSNDSDTDQPFKRRQLSQEESCHKRDGVSDEMLRKLYLRAQRDVAANKWHHSNTREGPPLPEKEDHVTLAEVPFVKVELSDDSVDTPLSDSLPAPEPLIQSAAEQRVPVEPVHQEPMPVQSTTTCSVRQPTSVVPTSTEKAPTLSKAGQNLYKRQEARDADVDEFLQEEQAAKRRQWELATKEQELRIELLRRELQWQEERCQMSRELHSLQVEFNELKTKMLSENLLPSQYM